VALIAFMLTPLSAAVAGAPQERRDSAVAGIRPDGPLVPARRVFFGAFQDLDSKWSGLRAEKRGITNYEERLGRKIKIDHHFYHWYQPMPGRIVQWDVRNGRIPMISWEPFDVYLNDIIQGQYDRHIRRKARALRSLRPARVFLRWAHEMNGYWYSWGGPNQNDEPLLNGPAKWIAAYQRIHTLFEQEGATNVVWVWGPNNESVPNEPWNNYMAYYPGDAYVDWVAVSGFNWGDLKSWSSWRSFRETFQGFYDDFALRKPIMIAETASAKTPRSRYRWLLRMGNDLREFMPSIAALVYYNSDPRWVVRPDDRAFRALKQVVNRRYFKPR
jgi:hypothetical protein